MNIDPKELEAGTKIEHEHTHDDALARKIATDHLREDPHYYSKLKAAGLEEDDEHPTQKADRLSKAAKTPEEHQAAHDAHKAALGHQSSVTPQSYRTYNWKKHHTDAMEKHAKAAGMKEGALTPQEAGMAECGGMDDGCPEDAGLPVAPEAKPAPVAAMVTIAAQSGQSGQAPLTSSGLGKGGANKPLTSTNLETPPDKKVGPNKVATTKTPPMAGGTSITNHSDPLDHFGSEMLGLCEGGSQIKKK